MSIKTNIKTGKDYVLLDNVVDATNAENNKKKKLYVNEKAGIQIKENIKTVKNSDSLSTDELLNYVFGDTEFFIRDEDEFDVKFN